MAFRHGSRPDALLALFALLALTTCSFPKDDSSHVEVLVTSPASVVLRGLSPLTLSAAAYFVQGTDSTLLRNVDFKWTSSDNATATVAPASGTPAYGDVTGIKRGTVTITVYAAGFASAAAGSVTLRVADPLEIDTIFPDSLEWGDKLTVIGVGVRQIRLAFINGGLIRDTFAFPDIPTTKVDTAQFFVPPPARTGIFLAASPDAFVAVPKAIGIDTVDLYEPNDTSARIISLDGAGPYQNYPEILFYNPALAFERTVGTAFRHKHYDFTRTDTTQALTFIYKPAVVNDTTLTFTYLLDSVDYSSGDYFISPGTHFLYGPGVGLYICDSLFFFADEAVADSIIEPLDPLPTSNVHLLSFYAVPGSFGITVLQGVHSQLPRDRFEPNDLLCRDTSTAHVNVARGLPATVDSALTIDRPHDLDFYRFRLVGVPGDTDTVTIKVVAKRDSADLDLTVLSPDFNSIFSQALGVGPRDSLSVRLGAGDYVLAVTDFPGIPTEYDLCYTVDAACTGLPATVARPSRAIMAARRRATRIRAAGPFAGLPRAGPASRLWRVPLAPRR